MREHTEQEVVQMIADQKVMLMTFEVLEEHVYDYAKKWLAHEPREWKDLPFAAKLFIGPLALAWACFALYYTALCCLGDLVTYAFQDAIADFDPSAKRIIPPCPQTVAENAQPVCT